MRSTTLLFSLLVLFITILVGCTSNSHISTSDREQIMKNVILVEETDYELINFRKSYKQYDETIRNIVSDEYWASISNRTLFGYDNLTYTLGDLATMTDEEYGKHKDRMLHIIHSMEFDQLSATVRISEAYEVNDSNQVNVYIYEDKNLKDLPFTTMTKKYTLEKFNEKWLITNMELDRFTYGSERTEVEIEEALKGLKYQTVNDKAIDYSTVIVLPGEGKQ